MKDTEIQMIKNLSDNKEDIPENLKTYQKYHYLLCSDSDWLLSFYDKIASEKLTQQAKQDHSNMPWIEHALAGDSAGYSDMWYAPKQHIAFIPKKMIGKEVDDAPSGACFIDPNANYVSYNRKTNVAVIRDVNTHKILGNEKLVGCKPVNMKTVKKYAIANFWNDLMCGLDFTLDKSVAKNPDNHNSDLDDELGSDYYEPVNDTKNHIKGYVFTDPA